MKEGDVCYYTNRHDKVSSSFGDNCSFGNRCTFGENAKFGRKNTFGEHCKFGDKSQFEGNCEFGSNCNFGDNCSFEGEGYASESSNTHCNETGKRRKGNEGSNLEVIFAIMVAVPIIITGLWLILRLIVPIMRN